MITHTAYLVVDKNRGILGTEDDYDCDDADCRVIEVTLNIPEAVFDPIEIKIDIPEDFISQRPISGEVQSVSVPVIVAGEKGQIKIVEELVEPSKGSNILALLKRAIFRS